MSEEIENNEQSQEIHRRESGHYYILKQNVWNIGFYSKTRDCWFRIADEKQYKDCDFEEIDERRIIRNSHLPIK